MDFMEKKDCYANIPSVIKPTLIVLVEMLIFVGLYVVGDIYMPLSTLRTVEFY